MGFPHSGRRSVARKRAPPRARAAALACDRLPPGSHFVAPSGAPPKAPVVAFAGVSPPTTAFRGPMGSPTEGP
eukprot:536091-Pyramimonas_sp.AAC.1